MFNKIRNFFKEREMTRNLDKLEVWSVYDTKTKQWSVSKSPPAVEYNLKLTALTKSELVALHSCMEFAIKGRQVGLNAGIRPAMTMKRLTDKGYLVRVKRGLYALSFFKQTKNTP
jgi:hypothetical protein